MPSSHKFLDKSPGTFSHPLKLVEHSLVFFGCSGWAGERDPFFWSEEFRFCRLFCAWYSGRGVHETMKGSTCLTVFFSKPKQSDSFNGRSKSLKFCVIVFFWGGDFLAVVKKSKKERPLHSTRAIYIHPGKWTSNLKITCSKRKIIFQTFIFGFHVLSSGTYRICMNFPQVTLLSVMQKPRFLPRQHHQSPSTLLRMPPPHIAQRYPTGPRPQSMSLC